jgi:hypothetical protein
MPAYRIRPLTRFGVPSLNGAKIVFEADVTLATVEARRHLDHRTLRRRPAQAWRRGRA